MKLIRFGAPGAEKPGLIDSAGRWRDVAAFGQDYNEAFFENKGLQNLAEWWALNEVNCPVVAEGTRLGPPVCRPSKLICVGLNYAQHARESGMTPPPEPVIFFKATTAICGPNDDLVIPRNSVKTDWEVELAFVIGKKAQYAALEDALDHVAGYLLHNDYSEREFQLERSGQWVKGKSADTFAPLGPWLATPDELGDPHQLRLCLSVNGEMLQDSNTSDLIFNIPFLIHYISQFMTLLPGDVISTGTPAGVGLGLKPPRYLVPGDVVVLGIDGLGEQRQTARANPQFL
jgi:2,4-didehydro-3-deoxy-L-rhamnonate hydrolase